MDREVIKHKLESLRRYLQCVAENGMNDFPVSRIRMRSMIF
ncbi:MAG: hypothetical protein JW384_00230 [Nitrosomonadaceae bacterium]|nr:hypothetical protein [Nitrosomonadaceae bacterium]